MKSTLILCSILILLLIILLSLPFFNNSFNNQTSQLLSKNTQSKYWLLLQRKSNLEFLYQGAPGEPQNSKLIRKFSVKVGVPGEKPTPLPQLLGLEYWLITDKYDSSSNPETAPYFLTLNVPFTENEPYGPESYLECNGQCNWQLPGAFGLHGINNDPSRLSFKNPGSSGCIRHTDEDITYLYSLLDPQVEPVRYYIQDI